jgi:hypothetical protein
VAIFLDENGSPMDRNPPRQTGWALHAAYVSEGGGLATSKPRICDNCGEMKRAAWPFASICHFCWIGDFERAKKQKARQDRAAYAAFVAAA